MDIILVLAKWLSKSPVYMIIEGDKLKEFLSKEHKKAMDEKIMFKVTDEISFECSLYPKGNKYKDNEVSWNMKMVSAMPDLKFIDLHVEGGCEEIENSVYKESMVLNTHYDYNKYQDPNFVPSRYAVECKLAHQLDNFLF